MVKPKASRFGLLRRGRHGVVSSPQLRWDGCVYPDTAMTRPIGALAIGHGSPPVVFVAGRAVTLRPGCHQTHHTSQIGFHRRRLVHFAYKLHTRQRWSRCSVIGNSSRREVHDGRTRGLTGRTGRMRPSRWGAGAGGDALRTIPAGRVCRP